MWKKFLVVLAMLYAAASFAAVDVNKASAAELDSIKGIGPGISSKIIDERKKGSFKDWQDFVDRVKGVGETNAAKFSAEGLTVNGSSFKGAAATKKDEKSAAKEDKKETKAAAKEEEEEKVAAKDEKKDAKAEANEGSRKARPKRRPRRPKKPKKAEEGKAEATKTAASAPKPAASAAKK